MTPERWRRTEELFFAASALPATARAAFLAEACANDAGLREEVESLLDVSEAESGFLDVAVPVPAAARETSMVGRSLGGYQIQSLLGSGGMGEVYLARDSKLHRAVAIKILPAAFISDRDRLARFEREARMLAALNHPNICAIYGLESVEAVRFLILELVEGQTLADVLAAASGRLPLEVTLRIARQIAEALEVAHEKGIIHRDLKPANIKITPDGIVKVLDFGLAKSVNEERPSAELTDVPTGDTRGMVLGTAAYMSPEQARGLAVDKRTDIWAFGCVLYQMLTGRLPFAGNTISDTVARILERDPDWSALPPSTPPVIRRVLARCLEKDHKQRMRDIGDVRIELNATDVVEAADAASAAAAPRRRAQRALPLVVAIAVVGVAAALAFLGWPRAVEPADPLSNMTMTRLTNWPGAEEGAVISSDGRFAAFLADHEGQFDVWLSQIGTGQSANLTRDVAPLVGAGAIVRKLGFNGDASELWFNPADRKPLLLVPLTGGVPRPFLPPASNTPAWSPDGSRVVFFGKPATGADPMYVADRSGADARELYTPPTAVHSNNPAWSTDGQWIYFVSGVEPQDEIDVNIWRIPASGGPAEQLTDQHAAANFVAPIDPRTVLYIAREDDGSGPWLWALDVETRVSRRVRAGVDQFTSVSASHDGRRVVATVANPSSSLWRVPILQGVATDRDTAAYTLPAPAGRAWAPRFSGGALFYLSARGTGDGLWKAQDNSATEVWRHVNGAIAEPPAIAPDGANVAVIIRRAGKRQLAIMSMDGTNPRSLAPAVEIEGAAGQANIDWSPDSASIIAGGQDADGDALFRIPVDGGAPRRIKEGKWVNPLWSPKGDVIVYAGRSNVGQVQPLAMRTDGTPVNLPQFWARPGGYRFLPDGSGLVYLPAIHAQDFWLLEFATMTTRPLTSFGKHGALRTFDVTPDGKYIVFDRSLENSDIVLFERPRSSP